MSFFEKINLSKKLSGEEIRRQTEDEYIKILDKLERLRAWHGDWTAEDLELEKKYLVEKNEIEKKLKLGKPEL